MTPWEIRSCTARCRISRPDRCLERAARRGGDRRRRAPRHRARNPSGVRPSPIWMAGEGRPHCAAPRGRRRGTCCRPQHPSRQDPRSRRRARRPTSARSSATTAFAQGTAKRVQCGRRSWRGWRCRRRRALGAPATRGRYGPDLRPSSCDGGRRKPLAMVAGVAARPMDGLCQAARGVLLTPGFRLGSRYSPVTLQPTGHLVKPRRCLRFRAADRPAYVRPAIASPRRKRPNAG